jgi:hypothetical protein
MRMRDIFEIEEVDGKIYMVCLDSDVLAGMIELNETAAYIVEKLMQETTTEEIAKQMCNEYETTFEDALEGINVIVGQLKQVNAIEE